MKYCVFSIATGVIRQEFNTPKAIAQQQLQKGEAIYFGSAAARFNRIVQRGDVDEQALRDFIKARPGSGEEADALALLQAQQACEVVEVEAEPERADDLIKMRMLILDTQTVDIEGEKINLQRSLLEYITAVDGSADEAAALDRLRKVQARKEELRAQLDG